MLKRAYENAKINLEQNKTMIKKDDMYYDLMAREFEKILGFVPQRIELFDNSHIAGESTCSAMVVYENLKP